MPVEKKLHPNHSDSLLGKPLTELETPALCLDLNVLEQQLADIAERCRVAGKQWRPAADWHLLPGIGAMQRSAGAIGFAFAKANEASQFLEQQPASVLLTQSPLTPAQLHHIGECARSHVMVLCDHYAQAEKLSRLAETIPTRIPVLIDLNVGLNRAGVQLGSDSRELVQGLARLPGVRLCGASADLGTLLPEDPSSKARLHSACGMLSELKNELIRFGQTCETVSVSFEGDDSHVLAAEIITEVRHGNLWARPVDGVSAANHPAILSVMATVISRCKLERAVLDVGYSRIAVDSSLPEIHRTISGRPLPDACVTEMSWESTTLDLGPASRDLIIGSRVELIPDHGAATVRQFRQIFGIRDGVVEAIWPID